MKQLPESTGWTLFSKTEKASRVERSETVSAVSSSLVKMYEICFPKSKQRIKNITPIATDTLRITLMANFAALAFPFPSSFDTRTLYKLHNKIDIKMLPTQLLFHWVDVSVSINPRLVFIKKRIKNSMADEHATSAQWDENKIFRITQY